MTLPGRLLLPFAMMLAIFIAGSGPSFADEATAPTTDPAEAATDPEVTATAPKPDCGCGARSPGQLLETQRRMIETSTEPGS